MYASKALIILVRSRNLFPGSSIVNSLISRGTCGRLVWKNGENLLESLCKNSPIEFELYTNHNTDISHIEIPVLQIKGSILNSNSKLLIISLDLADNIDEAIRVIEDIIISHIEEVRISFIVESCEFPRENSDSSGLADILPKQSYNFKDCNDISDSINRAESAFYTEYEKNYTRVD